VSLINGFEVLPEAVTRVGTGTRNWSAGLMAAWENRVWIGGTSPTVGAGFALGGGYSLVSRAFGMACDSVVAADIVLASGELVTANATNEHSELFWALRGAGAGNFGVVTHLSYALASPVPAVVSTWAFTWNASDALHSLVAWELFLLSVFEDKRVTPLVVVTGTGQTRSSGLFLGPQSELEEVLQSWLSMAPAPATSQLKEMSWLESMLAFEGCASVEVWGGLTFPIVRRSHSAPRTATLRQTAVRCRASSRCGRHIRHT
jgi:FAD/FMN-containing dehydrogenase